MVRPVILAVGAIPVIMALLIAVPLLTRPEIPSSAANPDDEIEIEYTRHHLKTVSFGVTERTVAQKTEILLIRDDGSLRYKVTSDGTVHPDVLGSLDASDAKRLTAMIKETGFITIPSESFPILDVDEYRKSTLMITLNGRTNQIHWPEQNATEKFIAPIVTMVQDELDMIIRDLNRYK